MTTLDKFGMTMNMHLAVIFFTLFFTLFFSLSNWAKSNPTSCAKKSLLLKDCHLNMGNSRVHLWNNKLFLKTPVQHDIVPLPVQGDQVEWDFAKVTGLNKKHYLEIGIWGLPQQLSDVESLIWSVYEIHNNKLNKIFEKGIRKRKMRDGGRYHYDKMPAFGLQFKKEHLLWYHGKEKGVLP